MGQPTTNLGDAFIEPERQYKNAVMHATWGHLAVEPLKLHKGYVLFAIGEFGDEVVIRSDFKDVPDSPWFYSAVHEFIGRWGKREHRGKVYQFSGTYRTMKNGRPVFKGKTRVVCA